MSHLFRRSNKEDIFNNGLIIEVFLSFPEERKYRLSNNKNVKHKTLRTNALIDTGVKQTIIHKRIMDQFNLWHHWYKRIYTIGQSEGFTVKTYGVSIKIAMSGDIISNLEVPASVWGKGDIALSGATEFVCIIGRNVLKDCISFYHGEAGFYSLNLKTW